VNAYSPLPLPVKARQNDERTLACYLGQALSSSDLASREDTFGHRLGLLAAESVMSIFNTALEMISPLSKPRPRTKAKARRQHDSAQALDHHEVGCLQLKERPLADRSTLDALRDASSIPAKATRTPQRRRRQPLSFIAAVSNDCTRHFLFESLGNFLGGACEEGGRPPKEGRPVSLARRDRMGHAKCRRYFTKAGDGLKQKWTGRVLHESSVRTWDWEMGQGAYEESVKSAELVVCLLPARTDTSWWHDYCLKAEVYFMRGRLKFGNAKNSAPFPSVIVTFSRKPAHYAITSSPCLDELAQRCTVSLILASPLTYRPSTSKTKQRRQILPAAPWDETKPSTLSSIENGNSV